MLKQKFLVQFGTSTITQALGMIAGLVVARIAGPGVLGILAFATSYTSILGFVNGLFGSAHIRLVSEGRDHKACMATYTVLQGLSVTVYFVATLAMFLVQNFAHDHKFESSDTQIVILMFLLANIIGQYEQYANVAFTANLQQAKANIPTFIKSIAWHIGRVLIVLLGFRAITLASFNLALAILLVPLIFNLLKQYPIGNFDKILAKAYVAIAVPSIIIEIVNNVVRYADKLLLAHFTNIEELGYYSAAYSLGGMFMLIAIPVGSIFFPLFSKMITANDWEGVNTNIRKYQEFISLFIFPMMVMLAIAGGGPLIVALGKSYQPSVVPFSVLIISTYVVLIGLPYGNVVTGMGRFYLWAWINVGQLVVFILSITILLSPGLLNLGALGLAINSLIMNLYIQICYFYFARKLGELKIDIKLIYRHGVVVIISLISIYLIQLVKNSFSLWWLGYVPLYLIVVYGTLILTGLLRKEHFDPLREALNFHRTLDYVNSELKS